MNAITQHFDADRLKVFNDYPRANHNLGYDSDATYALMAELNIACLVRDMTDHEVQEFLGRRAA